MHLISRLTDICAFRQMFPMQAPNRPINTPGSKKIGEKKAGPPNLTTIDTAIETTASNIWCSELSIDPMSCVHRVIIREVGVASSQLMKSLSTAGPRQATQMTYRNVALRIESTSCTLIIREALCVPEIQKPEAVIYITVQIARIEE